MTGMTRVTGWPVPARRHTRRLGKYWAVFRISLRNQWAYVPEQSVQGIFLVVIMYVFAELWSTTYGTMATSSIAGYGIASVVWYLAMTESIVMGCPRLAMRLSEEIKHGEIAYRLTKPIGYIGYNFAQYLGEASVRIGLNIVLAGMVAALFFGPPPASWASVLLTVVATALAVSTQFTMNMVIGLLLFWMEDGRGLDLILSRLVMILGGMMIPLPLFPDWLARVCAWLPFQVIAYLPARTLVHLRGYDIGQALATGCGWMLICLAVCTFLYGKGVKRLHVQGG
ncbi:ABC transporter permease [Alicyclobacillus shizuokensis]|uniref:ABC transporter permease n=1 Tax=Alicyclobacillus shizuokensis TaxID=392014 RepID=UPI0008318930|nr:ABC-2 family transporter protein [Alicyclobacillus shizuokensis]MCL6625747.1 ABC-2 family transporter protein [Alicyclobacillus shizuokensis]